MNNKNLLSEKFNKENLKIKTFQVAKMPLLDESVVHVYNHVYTYNLTLKSINYLIIMQTFSEFKM